MNLLLEATFQETIPKIKAGDKMEVNTDEKTVFDVISSSGQEIIVKKDKDEYLLRKNAYNNNTLDFFIKGASGFNRQGTLKNVKFIRIFRDNKPIEWITDTETEKDRQAIRNRINPQVKRQKERRFEFIKTIQGFNVGDKLKIIVGKVKDDGTVDELSKTIIEFVVMGLPKKYNYYLEYIKTQGSNKGNYDSLENVELLLINPKSPVITSHDDTIKIKLFSNSQNFTINNVLDIEKEKVDNSVIVTKDDIMGNKYFRDAMIKDASWLRKLFGNNIPKGIIPAMQKIKKSSKDSFVDNRIKKGNKILFNLKSEQVGIGNAIMSKSKKYFARIKEDFSFRVPLKGEDFNVYAKFNITGKDKLNENTYNVRIQVIKDEKGFNDVTKNFTGKIQIISYNY